MPSHDDTVVAGFVKCRLCPTLVLREVALKTEGLCIDDHRERGMAAKVREIEASLDGARVRARHSSKSAARMAGRKRERNRYRQLERVKEARRLDKAAHGRASRRLNALFPELYDMLLAEERLAAGLKGWTIDRLLSAGDARWSVDMLTAYHGATEPEDP